MPHAKDAKIAKSCTPETLSAVRPQPPDDDCSTGLISTWRSLRPLREATSSKPKNNKAPDPGGPGAKFGGGRSPRALSRRHTVGRLAFAGRVLPDATLRGMRMFRSHGGTVPTV